MTALRSTWCPRSMGSWPPRTRSRSPRSTPHRWLSRTSWSSSPRWPPTSAGPTSGTASRWPTRRCASLPASHRWPMRTSRCGCSPATTSHRSTPRRTSRPGTARSTRSASTTSCGACPAADRHLMATGDAEAARPGPGPSAARGGSELALEAAHLSKSFGGVRVLNDVSLQVKAGEIHGLVGSNGSGKSTLIKILSGFHAPDPGGSLKVRGEDVPLPVPPDRATKVGLSFVHQDLGLIPQLSVLENLRVGRFTAHPGWRISWREERATVRAELKRFELDVSPETKVQRLSSIERVLLAVVRAFSDLENAPGGVLLLDEPTAYLPRDGVDRLFTAVRRAAAEGAGVVFVSHRLEEIGMLTNSVSV